MEKSNAQNVLGVLKTKLAQSKADAEKYQEECDILREKLTSESAKLEEAEQETRSFKSRVQLLEDNLR